MFNRASTGDRRSGGLTDDFQGFRELSAQQRERERERVEKVVVKFTECKGKNAKTGKECTVKSKEGKGGAEAIETKDLKGELGETAESKTNVGLLLEGETSSVFVTVEGECLPVSPSAIEGSVVAEVKPVEEFKKTTTLVFPATAIKSFERSFAKHCTGAPTARECKEDFSFTPKLTAFGTETATETTEDVTTYEENLKVHAGS
ncbi:MAG: hypothetical protein ACRD6W_02590, partial [Nitrososphaerales archaeon]